MSKPSTRSIARKTGIALALSCIFAAGSAQAQTGILTQDTVNEGWSAAMAAFQKGEQFAQEVATVQSMVTSAESLGTNISLLPNTLQPINDPTSLIQANCNGASSGGIVGDVMNSLGSLLTQDASTSQQQICTQIVTTQVDKYNKTVVMLNKLSAYSGSLQKLQGMANSISNLGGSSSTTTQATTYSSELTTDMTNWETQMKADDAIIKTLQDQQVILTKMIMNGGGGSSILSDAQPDSTFQGLLGGG